MQCALGDWECGKKKKKFSSLSLPFSYQFIFYFCTQLLASAPSNVQQLLQGGDDSGGDSENFDWNTEDELEIENFQSSSSCLTVPNGEALTGSGEVSFQTHFFLSEVILVTVEC